MYLRNNQAVSLKEIDPATTSRKSSILTVDRWAAEQAYYMNDLYIEIKALNL